MTNEDREKLFDIIYQRTQKDYRIELGGDKMIMTAGNNGGVMLCSVDDLTDQELIKRSN